MPDPKNPFGFEIEVTGQSNLKNALSVVEKAYFNFSKKIKDVSKSLLDQAGAHVKAAREARKRAKQQEQASNNEGKQTKKRISLGTALSSILQRESKAAQAAGLSFDNLAYYIGGATVIGGIYYAAKAYMNFDSQIRELNTTLSGTPKIMQGSIAGIQQLNGFLGLTREEIITTTKFMSKLAVVLGDTAAGSKAFNEIRMNAIYMSRSMDVSTTSATEFYDQFVRIYKLPHHRLRGISASMKAIQESTGLTGEEILSFGKSLEDVLSRMRLATNESKVGAVRDFTAITGGLKTLGVNIEGTQLGGLFSEALKFDSDQGRRWLAFLSSRTGEGVDTIRKQLESGDLVTPTSLFIKALKKEGPEMLRLNERYYTEMTGLNFSQLKALTEVNDKSLREQVRAAANADAKRIRHEEVALKRQNRLSMMWNKLARSMENIWLKFGEAIVTVATKLADKAIPLIVSGISWLIKKLEWFASPAGGDAVLKWYIEIKNAFSALWGVLKGIGSVISSSIDYWNDLSTEGKTFVGVSGGILAVMLKMGPAMGLVGGKIALIAAGIAATALAGNELGKMAAELAMMAGIIEDPRKANKKKFGLTDKLQSESAQRTKSRDNLFDRLRSVGTTKNKEFELEKLRSEGVITPDNRVRFNSKYFTHPGEMLAAQNLLNASLDKPQITVAGQQAEPQVSKTEPIASSAPITSAIPPSTVQSQDSKQQLGYSRDIRDILLSIDRKISKSSVAPVHPSRLAQAASLGR